MFFPRAPVEILQPETAHFALGLLQKSSMCASSSACRNQKPTYKHRLACRLIHDRSSNPCETRASLLSGAIPGRFFSRGGRGGGLCGCSARHLTDQHPDKNHHGTITEPSRTKTTICNVWNHSKPFKIVSNMSFDTKNTPKSLKI